MLPDKNEATCSLSLQATTQHLCRYGNLSKLTMHSLFTPAQKSIQLTGPRSRRAQEVSFSIATPQSNSSKAVGLHHQHVCYISNASVCPFISFSIPENSVSSPNLKNQWRKLWFFEFLSNFTKCQTQVNTSSDLRKTKLQNKNPCYLIFTWECCD